MNQYPILEYFGYSHLPINLQEVSKPFCELADKLTGGRPYHSETDAALRKLLEAKDCAVRAMLT